MRISSSYATEISKTSTFYLYQSKCLLPFNRIKTNEITYQIYGVIYEVNRVLGAGFLENVYENALMIELKDRGLKAESQVPISVQYKNAQVGEYFTDIAVEVEVILELKAVESLEKIHEAQLLDYLKATQYKVGLLVNFTHPKATIRRFVL